MGFELKDIGKALQVVVPTLLGGGATGAAAAAGGLTKFAGGLLPIAADYLGTASANKQNIKLAREQMAFQERMSSTEMQRRKADLLAAGLNPMAAMSIGGASSAQGARAEVESPTARAVNTALSLQAQKAQIEQMQEQTRLLRAQGENVQADTTLKVGSANMQATQWQIMEHDLLRAAQQVKQSIAQTGITEEDLRNKRLTNDQLEKLNPVILTIQKLERDARALGMTQKEIDQKFTEDLGLAGKWLSYIRGLID